MLRSLEAIERSDVALLVLAEPVTDVAPLIVIITPVLLPVMKATGMDPVTFGVLLMVNLGIGLNLGTGIPLTDLAANPNYQNSGEIPVTVRGGCSSTRSPSAPPSSPTAIPSPARRAAPSHWKSIPGRA